MKSVAIGLQLGLLGALFFCQPAFADTAAQQPYRYTAARGRWPANAGEGGDRRFVTAVLSEKDMPAFADMKASGRDMAVLFMGWDWCEAGNLLLPAWRQGLGDRFVTTVYDRPEQDFTAEGPDGKPLNLSALSRDRLHAGPLYTPGGASGRSHSWPAVGFADSEGKAYALFPSVDVTDNAGLRRLAEKARGHYGDYLRRKAAAEAVTEASFRAAAARGDRGMRVRGDTVTDAGGRSVTADIYRAALLADALTALEPNVRALWELNSPAMRREDFSRIRTWDPKDVSGAMRRLTGSDLYHAARSYCRKPDAEQEKRLAADTDNTRLVALSDNELQQRLLFGHNLYFREDRAQSLYYARLAERVNPASFWGEGARGRLLMCGVGPVTLGSGWDARHFRVPEALTLKDGRTVSADTVAKADRATVDPAKRTFRWELRWGNDLKLCRRGWYELTLTMRPELPGKPRTPCRPMTVDSLKIYRNASRAEVPSDALCGQPLFDGTEATARAHLPKNGDDMGVFSTVSFPYRLEPNASLRVMFYVPESLPQLPVPLRAKDASGDPPYNRTAIVIAGTYEGESTGFFRVRPVLTSKGARAPGATEVTVDGKTLSLQEVFKNADAVAAAAEPPKGADGQTVADAAERALSENPDYAAMLARAELIRAYQLSGKEAMSEVLDEDLYGRAMLEALFADRTWLTDVLASGPTASGGARSGGRRSAPHEVLRQLALMWRLDLIRQNEIPHRRRGTLTAAPGSRDYDPLFRRLATAVALNSEPMGNGTSGQTYLTYCRFIEEGRLHGDFYTTGVPMMRHAVNPVGYHWSNLEYAVRSGNTRINEINGTAWQVRYRSYSFFNDTVQGPRYSQPWRVTTLSDIALGREIGAVCGGISHYGVLAAVASGRRSVPGGQPGHCAAAHRRFDGRLWDIDSNVHAPTGNQFPLWGLNMYHSLEYLDDMFDDPGTLTAYRLLWASRLRRRRYGEDDPGAAALLERAAARGPLCYAVLKEWASTLKRGTPEGEAAFDRWADAVAFGLWRYPQIGWSLLNSELYRRQSFPEDPRRLADRLCRLHRKMGWSDRSTRERYNYASWVLLRHLRSLKDSALRLRVLTAALETMYGTPRFLQVLHCGRSELKTPETQRRLTEELKRIYAAHGDAAGIRGTCADELEQLSRQGQPAAYRSLASLCEELWPAEAPAPALPETGFTRPLLSAEGVISLSSYVRPARNRTEAALKAQVAPLRYALRVLDGTAGDRSVRTQPSAGDAWISVCLPGDAEPEGVVLTAGRYAVRGRLEVSSDGRTWVLLTDSADLKPGERRRFPVGRSVIARYVRLLMPNPAKDRKQVLELREFRVYAKPRY